MRGEAEVQGPLDSIRFGDAFPFDTSIYVFKQIAFYRYFIVLGLTHYTK